MLSNNKAKIKLNNFQKLMIKILLDRIDETECVNILQADLAELLYTDQGNINKNLCKLRDKGLLDYDHTYGLTKIYLSDLVEMTNKNLIDLNIYPDKNTALDEDKQKRKSPKLKLVADNINLNVRNINDVSKNKKIGDKNHVEIKNIK